MTTLGLYFALCGSAMEVGGTGHQIHHNDVAENGFQEGEGPNGAWSDGITVPDCRDTDVYFNTLTDNTDVDLIKGPGEDCQVSSNMIRHVSKYGFAGVMAGFGGDHSSPQGVPMSTISGNTVTAGLNTAAFGVMVGHHPWESAVTSSHTGTVSDITASGAVINLAVEGVTAGTIGNHTLSNAQGTNGFGVCSVSANYTRFRRGQEVLPNGGINLLYHDSSCTIQ